MKWLIISHAVAAIAKRGGADAGAAPGNAGRWLQGRWSPESTGSDVA